MGNVTRNFLVANVTRKSGVLDVLYRYYEDVSEVSPTAFRTNALTLTSNDNPSPYFWIPPSVERGNKIVASCAF